MTTFYNRVQVQATSTGTAAFSLGLAVPSYNSFSGVPNQTYVDYLAVASDNTWEIGVGQYNATPNTLTRVSVESSSNANALVNFAVAPTVGVVTPASWLNSPAAPTYLPLAGGTMTGSINMGGQNMTNGGTLSATGGTFTNPVNVGNATAAANAVALGQFPSSFGQDGYAKLPNGLIIQWGAAGNVTVGTGGTNTQSITYPTTFPNGTLQVFATSVEPGLVASANNYAATGFDIYTSNWTPVSQTGFVNWLALGY